MSDFADLLQEAEKLTTDIEGTTDLPKVERSIRQVLEASNELYSKVAQNGSKDIQANLLLGSKGIDLPRIAQKLDVISSKPTFEQLEEGELTDISAALENELRNSIIHMLDESSNKLFDNIMAEAWEHDAGEWKQEKRKILNAMTAPSGAAVDISETRSMYLPRPAFETHFMDKEDVVYAREVMEYNRPLTTSHKKNLIHVFAKAAQEFQDVKINEMWEIMKYMTNLPAFPRGDDPVAFRTSESVVKVLVKQAKNYLEDRYKTYMENVINENLVAAQRGGIPGTYTLVKSFVGIRFQGEYAGFVDGQVEGRPLWAMVYYCLRCGDIAATLHCLKNATVDCTELIKILEQRFNTPNHPDITKFETPIKFQYQRQVRNSSDPFKRLVFCVLGCCDIKDEHSEVARTADDYLWLKLNLIRFDVDKDHEHVNYSDLQMMILEEYGESHYDAQNKPHLYFQVLALTGQFEAAIEFLARIDRYRIHAVHIAIALKELYILIGPKNFSSPLLFIDPADPKPIRRLNIARLIMVHVRKFEMTCIEEAVHYFYLLHNLQNEDKSNVYMICVCDLAIETREYEKLFGKLQQNGIRTKGVIDFFENAEITVERFAEMVGGLLVNKGMYEDAIELYDLSTNHTEVLRLLCILLSQIVHKPPNTAESRERLQAKSKEIYLRYQRDGFKCSQSLVSSFVILKELVNFFDYYHTKQFPAALKVIQDVRLIPFKMEDVEERISTFKKLTDDVCRVIPDLMLSIMNMLFDQYQKLKENEYIPGTSSIAINQQMDYIRNQAKAITHFTGMLPYRMPGDTNSRLVQMEILMH